MQKLTVRQLQIYNLIKESIQETGIPPTRVEIANRLGFKSANAAEEHLKALQKKGMIEILAGTSRGIKLLHLDDYSQEIQDEGIPLIGMVAAGEPILAQQHIVDHYKIANNMFKPSADFLLKVRGESMINIGIFDGDLLAVHKTNQVRNGQIVVARINDDVTVKRFQKDGQTVYLHAENDDFKTIIVDLAKQQFNIEGIAVGVIRNNFS